VNALKLKKIIKYNDLESPPNFYQVGAGLCRKCFEEIIEVTKNETVDFPNDGLENPKNDDINSQIDSDRKSKINAKEAISSFASNQKCNYKL
jgi:hypothetical protein